MVPALRIAIRSLLRHRAITLGVILTLGLGIGANAALFSVVNAFLFRPLPVPDAGALVVLGCRHESNRTLHNLSYLDLADLRAAGGPFTGLAAYGMGLPGLAADGRAERVLATYVTPDYFAVLGLPPGQGRLFRADESEDVPHVVIGHGLWTRRFGADPAVVGRLVHVNGQPFTVIGVVPAGFLGAYNLVESDLYLPLGAATALGEYPDLKAKRDDHSLHVLGRLKPGATLADAGASLGVVGGRLAASYPATNRDVTFEAVPETLARPEANNADSAPLVAGVFTALVGLVLLVACVNAANLLLVRATTRAQELAVRSALGASRGTLVRQLLTESLLLAAAAGVLGLLVGRGGTALLGRVRISNLPFVLDLGFDWRVFAWVTGAVLVAGVAAGLAPALRATRLDLVPALREGSRGVAGGRHLLRDGLVVLQITASVVLLVVAGLFVRSLAHSRGMDLGFRPSGVVNAAVNVAQVGYDEARGRAFFAELERRAVAVPGVESVAFANTLPMGYMSAGTRAALSAAGLASRDSGVDLGYNSVSPAYFATLGVPLRRGRAFTEADGADAPRVAVINEELARQLWPGADPLGRHLVLDLPGGADVEVVGVTATGKYGSITEDPAPYAYLPLAQSYQPLRIVQVRTALPAATVGRALVDAVGDLDPSLPVTDVGSMEQALQGPNGFFLIKGAAGLAGILGGLGLFLAVVGVYGVVSYSAAQRSREIGIRLALGAARKDVARLVVAHGAVLAGCGLAAGSALALLGGRAVEGLLLGIRPSDPLTYAVVGAVLGLTVAAASLVPALRATRVSPADVLREG